MPTIDELGRKAKKKFPEKYGRLSDAETGDLVLREHPEYAKRYSGYEPKDTSMVLRDKSTSLKKKVEEISTEITQVFSEGLDAKSQATLRDFHPTRGRFFGWFAKKRVQQQEEIYASVSSNHSVMLRTYMDHARALREGKMEELAFNQFLAKHAYGMLEMEAAVQRLEKATELGIPELDYTRIQVRKFDWEQEKDEISFKDQKEIDKKRAEAQIEVEKEGGLSGIRINEHDRKSQKDLDVSIEKAQEAVRLAMLSKTMSEHQAVHFIQDSINQMYAEIDKLPERFTNPALIQAATDDLMEIIETFKKDRRARQNRLLQTDNRKET